jgi:hypothetical protein
MPHKTKGFPHIEFNRNITQNDLVLFPWPTLGKFISNLVQFNHTKNTLPTVHLLTLVPVFPYGIVLLPIDNGDGTGILEDLQSSKETAQVWDETHFLEDF